MIIEGTSLVPEHEALPRFRLEERVSHYASGGPLSGPNEFVCVAEGDLRIEGNLELAHLGHAGLIVEGNLEVIGSIIDDHDISGCERSEENDGIPFLLVGGNLHARNVVVGSSLMCVERNAEIDDLLLLHGFESGLRVAGTARKGLAVDAYGGYRAGFPLSDHLHRDIPIVRNDEEKPITIEEVDAELLIARIRAGLPVLRDPDDPRPRKSYAAWFADCEKYGEALDLVPREMVDSAICLAAVRSYGHAIAHVPRELVTDEMCDAALAENPYALRSMPVEFRTGERCRLAVQHEGEILATVPVELRTPELCALAFDRAYRINQVIPFIPEELLTPELCLRAAKRDGLILGNIPERFRTFDVCVAAVLENVFVLPEVPAAICDEVANAVRPAVIELFKEPRASKRKR